MRMTKINFGAMTVLAASLLGGASSLIPLQSLAQSEPADRDKKNPQDERDRQTDGKASILYAHSPPGTGLDTCVASIRIGEKSETHLFKRKERFQPFEDGFRISPNGKQVAYRRNRQTDDGTQYAIHIRNLNEKGNPVDMEVEGQEVCWSPDGRKLAVSGGPAGAAIVDVATKKETQIELPKMHSILDWSPDGTWFLVYCPKDKGNGQLARRKKGDAELKVLAGTHGDVSGGRISPDGKQVLFERWVGKENKLISHLWIAVLADGKTRQLKTESNGRVRGFSWSPSGKRIAYSWVRFDPNSSTNPIQQETEAFLMTIDADGRNQTALLSDTRGGVIAVHYCLWDWR